MDYYKLNKDRISESILQQVISSLVEGAVIGYPTETVYGIGCDAYNSTAIEKIYKLKGRNYSLPLIVLVDDKSTVQELTTYIPETAEVLMNEFWPGPLTIIFKASSSVPEILNNGKGTIGLRISSDPICKNILENFKMPLVSTSANPTGSTPAKSAEELKGYFGSKIDVIIDSGPRNQDLVSTIIDVSSNNLEFEREGAITRSQILQVIEKYNE